MCSSDLVLSRGPVAEELALLTRAVDHYRARYAADAEGARQVIHVGEAAVRSSASPTDLAAWTLVANLILNLDETVTRN